MFANAAAVAERRVNLSAVRTEGDCGAPESLNTQATFVAFLQDLSHWTFFQPQRTRSLGNYHGRTIIIENSSHDLGSFLQVVRVNNLHFVDAETPRNILKLNDPCFLS